MGNCHQSLTNASQFFLRLIELNSWNDDEYRLNKINFYRCLFDLKVKIHAELRLLFLSYFDWSVLIIFICLFSMDFILSVFFIFFILILLILIGDGPMTRIKLIIELFDFE